MVKLKLYVTPLWYNNPSYFVEKVKTLTAIYNGNLDKMCVSLDYSFYKPALTESSIKRIECLTHMFHKVILEHTEGVDFKGYQDQIEALNVEVYEGRAPESAWKYT